MRRAMCQWAQALHFTFNFSNSRPIETSLTKISINQYFAQLIAKRTNESRHWAGLRAIISSMRRMELVTSLALNTA